jgi:hypothetical protein
MASEIAHTVTTSPQHHGVIVRAAVQVRQFMCGLHGHDTLKHFERGRISLLCASCGYETPGWDVKVASSRRDTTDAPRVVSLPLVGQRRAA